MMPVVVARGQDPVLSCAMHVAAACLSTVLVVWLVVIQPVVGRARYEKLSSAGSQGQSRRLRAYRNSAVREWALVGAVAIVGALSDRGPSAVGIPTSDLFPFDRAETASILVAGVVAVFVGTILVWAVSPPVRMRMARTVRGAALLLPRSAAERLGFVGVAITAGSCEEILYRGFGFQYVRWLLPHSDVGTAIVVTSVAFGVAHAYQGWLGIVATGVVGAILGWCYWATGSLVVVMILHALIDLRAIALPSSLVEALRVSVTGRRPHLAPTDPIGDHP